MLSTLLCLVGLGCWSMAQDLSPPDSILNKLSFEPEIFPVHNQPRESFTQRETSPNRLRQPSDGRQQRRRYVPDRSQGFESPSDGTREGFVHPQLNNEIGPRALPRRVPESSGRRGPYGVSQDSPEHSTEYNPYRPPNNHFSQSERPNQLPHSQQNPFANRALVRPVETDSQTRYPGYQSPSRLIPIHHEGPAFGEGHSPGERHYPRNVSPVGSHEGPVRRVPNVKPIGGFDNLADGILTGTPSNLLAPELLNTRSTNRKPRNEQFTTGYPTQINPDPQYGTGRSPPREPQYQRRRNVPNDSRLFPTENHNSHPNPPLLPIPQFGVPLGPPKPIVPVNVQDNEQRRDPTYNDPSDLRVGRFAAREERHGQSNPASEADQYSQYPGVPSEVHQGQRNHRPVQQSFRYPPGTHGVLADQPNQQHFPVGPAAQQGQLNQQYLPVGRGGHADQPSLSGVGHESHSPVYTPPTVHQGQQYIPPTGQHEQQYTSPTGQQGLQYTPPTGQEQQYTPPTGQGQQYTPSKGDQGQQYISPTGQHEQQYSPPTGLQGQQYASPTGQQGLQYTPPTGQGQQYTPPTGQGQQYTPPTGQQGEQYIPPTAQQGEQYIPSTAQQEQKYTSPTGQQGVQYTPPTGQGQQYTPPTGQQGEQYTPTKDQYQDHGPSPVSQPAQTQSSQSPDTIQDQTHTEYPIESPPHDNSDLLHGASKQQAVSTNPNLHGSDASPNRDSFVTEINPTLHAFNNAAGRPGKVGISHDQADAYLPDISHSAAPDTSQAKPETLNDAIVGHYGEHAPANSGAPESSGHVVPSTNQGNKRTDVVQHKLPGAGSGSGSVQENPTPHKQAAPTSGAQVPVLNGSAAKQTISDALSALNPSNSHFVPPGLQGQCYKYKDLSAGYSPSDDSFEYPDDAINAEMREKTFLAPILGFKNFAQPDTQFGLIPFGNPKGNNNQHVNDYLYSANVYPTGYKEGDFKMATPSDYTCRSTQTTLRMFKLYGGRCWTVNPDYQRVTYKTCGAPGLQCSSCSNRSHTSGSGGRCSEDYDWVKVWGYCEKATPGQRVRQMRLYLPTGCSCKKYYC